MTSEIKLDPDSSMWDWITIDLRFQTKKSGMSYAAVARLLNRSYSNVSNIMAGRRKIKEEDAKTLDAHWDLGEHFTRLVRYAKRDGSREWFREYLEYEAASSVVKAYEALAVPGLLQIPEYAAALIRELGSADAEDQVKRRIARQAILSKTPPPSLYVLLSQNALNWPVGGAEVMRDQLAHFLEMAERPNVGIRVVPLSSGAHAGFDGSFTLIYGEAGDVAYTEAPGRGRLVDSPSEVREYWDRYDRIGQVALPVAPSLQLIREAMEAL
ncbi:helix-turn-helix transcriptional regulator [Actinoallomurus acanthiterrae]